MLQTADFHLSEMQKAFWRNCNHRWNIKTGATRSGKTYLDYYIIPRRIRQCKGQGLIVLLGNTKGTLQRNIIDPMRDLFGSELVGNISSDNTVKLFGRKCYALGADKANQVERIQGAGIEYCYGDEITTWHEDVFTMLKSRLDKPNSCFDGTCNPDNPNHWFKAFLDQKDIDIYKQAYRIYDNPFLEPEFIKNLEKEYAGTVYFDRFILGLWKAAEGLIYRQFADNPDKYILKFNGSVEKDEYFRDVAFISIGVDFGGNRSLTTFVATAVHRNYSKLTVIADYHIEGTKGDIDSERVNSEFIGFVQRLREQYPNCGIRYCFADSAEQYLINGMKRACRRAGLNISVGDSDKATITSRIYCGNTLLNTGRLFLTDNCKLLRGGIECAVWDKDAAEKGRDERLDNFSTDIDILDAWEYSFSAFINRLIPKI